MFDMLSSSIHHRTASGDVSLCRTRPFAPQWPRSLSRTSSSVLPRTSIVIAVKTRLVDDDLTRKERERERWGGKITSRKYEVYSSAHLVARREKERRMQCSLNASDNILISIRLCASS